MTQRTGIPIITINFILKEISKGFILLIINRNRKYMQKVATISNIGTDKILLICSFSQNGENTSRRVIEKKPKAQNDQLICSLNENILGEKNVAESFFRSLLILFQ